MRAWISFVVAIIGSAAFLTGCATLPPDLPPVPVGPPALPPPAPSFPRPRRELPPVPVTSPAPSPQVESVPNSRIAPGAPLLAAEVERTADEVLRLQVFLDRANFSPGTLDGRWGPQTENALAAWQKREGLLSRGELDDEMRLKLPSESDAWTTYTVTAEDHQELRPVYAGWIEKSEADTLGYSTMLESVAERFHSTQRAMREWNPAAPWPDPPAGTVLRVPQLLPAERVRAARIEIHLLSKYLQAFDAAGKLIAYFPCSIARKVEKRPVGELHITNAAENPNYTFDPELFSEDPTAKAIGRKLVIPPGPNNPVGVAWLSLDRPGYGIHGTPVPEDIGRTESHGCFRLANWNATKLLRMISIGTPVFVIE
ncbi:MAG: L,D-transpeptidase [Kiritimatiellae bacterium]|nr:L,D-transpeptidase [Kiritimatiellia bacterium]